METAKFGHDLGRILLRLSEFSLDLRLKEFNCLQEFRFTKKKILHQGF